MTHAGPASTTRRVHLSHFAIPLGLAGLGGTWTAATQFLGAPEWPDDVLFTVSLILWVIYTAIYVFERVRRLTEFRNDRENPGSGPGAAYLPAIGIILTAHFGQYFPEAAPWVCGVFVAALGIVIGQLFAYWLNGTIRMESLHTGFFLPVVAGPFIASLGLSSVNAHPAAIAAFGVGLFFWLIIGGIVVARLITGEPLPRAALPSLSVLLAPPATGGVAWFAANDGAIDVVQLQFCGVVVTMIAIQLFLVREYLSVPFSLGFWAFSFPIASSANYAIRWFHASPFDGWQVAGWIALSLSTLVTLTIATFTIARALAARRQRQRSAG